MLTLLRRLFSGRPEGRPEENFFISSGLEFYGDLVARASSGRIEGKFDGHIIECRKLIIGPHATIKGNVFAEEIFVYGYCEGNLYAAGDLKVFDTAVILGDIHASSLIVEHNATFRGNLRKLRAEDFLEITAREKDKIVQQRKSNVYNIHSLNARLEAEQRRARKVANGLPLTPEPEVLTGAPLKRVQSASPIVIPQNRLALSPVTTGSEMPRAINFHPTPVDVSTLSGGTSDFMVPTMDESFLPDYVLPPQTDRNENALENQDKVMTIEEQHIAPSASMLLLEAQTIVSDEENPEAATRQESIIDQPVMADEIAVEEPLFEAYSVEAEARVDLVETDMSTTESPSSFHSVSDFFMEKDDTDEMMVPEVHEIESLSSAYDQEVDVQNFVGDISTAEAFTDGEEDFFEEEPFEIMAKEIVVSNVDFDITDEKVEMVAEVNEEDSPVMSFSDSILAPAIEPFPFFSNDNGIRIDPSVPYIRIPDAAPDSEEFSADQDDAAEEMRAMLAEESGDDDQLEGDQSHSSDVLVESRLKPSSITIPRQLSRPEAYQLDESSGTMIIIRGNREKAVEEASVLNSQQQECDIDSETESMESEETRYRISAVPTAEPGYEPGYTNQQRNSRMPVTVQPENTRQWF
jgi:cytoskeletal protein CcmA (bactofilin family)